MTSGHATRASSWARHKIVAFRVVFSVMFRADWRRALVVCLLRPSNSAGPIVAAVWLKLMVDAVSNGSGLVMPAAGLGVTFAVILAFSWAGMVTEARLHEMATQEFDRRVVRFVLRTPTLTVLEHPEYQNRLERLRDDSASVPSTLSATIDMFAAFAATTSALVILASVHPALLALAVCAIPSFLLAGKTERFRQQMLDELAEPIRESGSIFDLATAVGPAKELRILGVGEELISRYEKQSTEIIEAGRRAWLRVAAWRSAGFAVFALGFAGGLGFVVHGAIQGEHSLGDIVMTLVVGVQVNATIAFVAHSVGFAFATVHAVDRYLWIEGLAGEPRATSRVRTPFPSPQARGSGDGTDRATAIDLIDVGFTYPDGTVALEHLDVTFPAGTVTLLVGENGAGKSTLVKIVAGLLQPTTGEVTVQGTRLRDIDIDEWRQSLSAAFQDFARFELYAKEVVGVGDLPRLESTAAVANAMIRAGSPGLFETFPFGPDTPLGKSFHDGHDPSGGEWQKLALGRAMMRDIPRVLLLDEPTSSLDPLAEHQVLSAYGQACQRLCKVSGGIAIVTSHRLSSVRLADRIAVLSQGKVLEVGTHQELIDRNERYAELYEIQSQAYVDKTV